MQLLHSETYFLIGIQSIARTVPGNLEPLRRRRALTSASSNVVPPPTGHMNRHQGLEELAMVGNTQVQQLMRDNEILEVGVLISKVGGQGDDS